MAHVEPAGCLEDSTVWILQAVWVVSRFCNSRRACLFRVYAFRGSGKVLGFEVELLITGSRGIIEGS